MRSCIFCIITPVFSVTRSSEIILICWFAVQETFLIIINAVLHNIFVETDTFYFQASQMNRKFRRTEFIWNRNHSTLEMSLMALSNTLMHPYWKQIYNNVFNLLTHNAGNSRVRGLFLRNRNWCRIGDLPCVLMCILSTLSALNSIENV